MEETKALILNLRPDNPKSRDNRTYTEVQVKKILYAFARDLGCKWSKKSWMSLLRQSSILTKNENAAINKD